MPSGFEARQKYKLSLVLIPAYFHLPLLGTLVEGPGEDVVVATVGQKERREGWERTGGWRDRQGRVGEGEVGCQVLRVGSRVLGVQVSWYYDVMDPLLILLLCLAHSPE